MRGNVANHYEVLGVRRKATAAEIRSAYRTRAREYHPDVSDAPDAADKFVAVTEAYEVLSDPIRREQYDTTLTYQDLLEKRRAETPPPPTEQTRTYFQSDPPPHREGPKREERMTAAQLAPEVLKLTTLHQQGRITEAKTLAESILRRNETIALAHGILGDIARQEGDLAGAAQKYALAAQYDQRSDHYHNLHVEMLNEVQRRQRSVSIDRPDDIRPGPLGAGLFIIVSAISYLVVAQEPAVFSSFAPISTWSLGMLAMLLLSGLATGICLSLSEVMDTFSASQPIVAGRAPRAVIYTGLSLINFWGAFVIYLLLSGIRQSHNPSLSRWFFGVGAVVTMIAVAMLVKSSTAATQTFVWGGNVAAVGGLVGWMLADLFRRRSHPSA